MPQIDTLISAIGDAVLVNDLIPMACPAFIGGRYELVEVIGVGGRACTYRAVDRTLSSSGHSAAVVVKVYRPGVAEEQESLFARRIEHPSIVRILDRGPSEAGFRFCALEYLPGGAVADLDRLPPLRQAVAWVRDLARGVQAAHDRGVIHCDIKPQNVLLTSEGKPKLADFDLACEFNHPGNERRGTVTYIAPEVYHAEPGCITPAADVYGLGALLYFLLSRRAPNGQSPEEARAYLGDEAAMIAMPSVPPTLEKVLRRALARHRNERYRAAGELADDLDKWLSHRPIDWQRPPLLEVARLWTKRRPAAAIAASCLVVAIVGTTVGIFEWNRREQARVIAMQEEATRRANAEIVRLKNRSGAVLENMIQGLVNYSPSEEILPAVVWTHWFGDNTVVSPDGKFLTADAHKEILQRYLTEYEALEGPEGIQTTLVRYALGHVLLLKGDWQASEACFTRNIEAWEHRQAGSDVLLARCRALRSCAQARQAAQADVSAWVTTLDDLLTNAEVGVLGNSVMNEIARTRDSLKAGARGGVKGNGSLATQTQR